MTGACRLNRLVATGLLLALAGAASAQDQPRRAVSGRTAPADRGTGAAAGESGWCFGAAAGVLAGGDLYQVVNDLTVPWTRPVGGAGFNAKRFTVTLDEDAVFGIAAAKRITPRGWLRLDLMTGQMDATALANDSQFVTPVLYDRWNVMLLALGWEQRLTDTRLQPLIQAGVSLTGIDASAAASDQSAVGLRLGAGLVYRVGGLWSAGLEFADQIQQFHQDGLPVEMAYPAGARYREIGPQHLVVIAARMLARF